jgi:hypothetical protein
MKVNYYRIINDALETAVRAAATNDVTGGPEGGEALSEIVISRLADGIADRFWIEIDDVLTFPDFHKED